MKVPALVRLIRPKQWSKNAFVLAPLVFSFKLTDKAFVVSSLLACVVFCLTSSIIYIVNDIVDVDADRKHPKKRKRPLASGEVKSPEAVMLALLMAAGIVAVISYSHLTILFMAIMGLYVVQSLSYSLGLKHVTLLELFVVASGYVLRLLAGCIAIHEVPSPWILAATGTVALLITAGKRRAEMAEGHDPQKLRRSLQSYNLTFLDGMINMLASVTVVTYLLFTTSDYAISRFHSSYFVATSVFVLYGVLRYLQLVKVEVGADDPTTLVLTDNSLRLAVFFWIVTCILLIYN